VTGTMLRIRSARALDDYARFQQVKVEAETLTWPGDLDFDPDTLIWGGVPPSGTDSRPPRFLRLPRRSPSPAS
jgi:hypothetical protein